MNEKKTQAELPCETATNRSITTTCELCNGNCGGSCGLSMFLEDGVVVKTRGQKEHPISRGHICPKGVAIPEILRDPDRLKYPLKKTRNGRWKKISWDMAIDLVAQQLGVIKSKYGPEAIAVHVGHGGVRKEFTPYAERFCNVFGTPNFSTAGSLCYLAKMMANILTCGGLPVPDQENSKCIIFWGYNPSESYPPIARLVDDACSKGAKFIVIDPRRTRLARKADLHLQLRPGTDGALALGLINVIIKHNLYDKEFVDDWTIGFDKLNQLVSDYTPEKVEKITWVSANMIKQAAFLYSRPRPASISVGIAPELQTNALQSLRAISIIQAITGNLDVSGGVVFADPPPLSPLKLENPIKKPAIGQDEFPLFYKLANRAQANLYSRAIIEDKPYPIKGMIVAGSNPVLTWPNTGRVQEALASLEFLTVIDPHMTETAMLADLVLPVASYFERNEIWDHSYFLGKLRIGLSGKVISNKDCITDWMFWVKLARRMGYEEYFPWENEEEALNYRLKPIGITIEELSKLPAGYVYGKQREKKYEVEGFNTPSGKVEIYCKELERYGYDPLPNYVEPDESPESKPDLAVDYPFILTTGARKLAYVHSRYRNLPALRKLVPKPYVEINNNRAGELGLKEGEKVIVETLRGSIELKVKLTDEIDPRVIYVPHGWSESNANILTDDKSLDPISGFPPLRSLLARISKRV